MPSLLSPDDLPDLAGGGLLGRGSDLSGPSISPDTSLADAWDYNTQAVGDYVARQRALADQSGQWNPDTGLPTAKGATDALTQYRDALLMGTTAPGFRAFHGSPHDFERFDTSRIGTGEGNQAFGHGLYVAENEGVARGYRDQLAPDPTQLPEAGPLRAALQKDDFLGFDNVWQAVGAMRAHPDYTQRWDVSPETVDAFTAYEKARTANRGKMYEVNVGADPLHFLDWDKPLSEQSPHVQQAIASDPKLSAIIEGQDHSDIATAGDWVKRTTTGRNTAEMDPEELSKLLQSAGIPGIKYLDQGSRRAGEGTRNHVIFDDRTLSIIRKYGIGGLMLAGWGSQGGDSR